MDGFHGRCHDCVAELYHHIQFQSESHRHSAWMDILRISEDSHNHSRICSVVFCAQDQPVYSATVGNRRRIPDSAAGGQFIDDTDYRLADDVEHQRPGVFQHMEHIHNSHVQLLADGYSTPCDQISVYLDNDHRQRAHTCNHARFKHKLVRTGIGAENRGRRTVQAGGAAEPRQQPSREFAQRHSG